MIRLNNISIDYGGEYLFRSISLLIKKNDRIGLIGNNGSGKTTLLKILANKQEVSSGNIQKDNNLKISYLPQDLSLNSNMTIKDYAMGSGEKIKILEEELDRLNNQIKCTKEEKEQLIIFEQIDNVYQQIDKINVLKREIISEKIMKGLGFLDTDFTSQVNTLSGGWKMRAELSRILIEEPDIILLDEPTNHLDLPAILWLEKFLKTTKCTIILVSHDIDFLDKNVNRILNISNKTIKDFKGNYSKYVIHREQEIERQIREKKNQDKYIKQANSLIEKFRYKKNKAAFAQTLIRRLKKMEKIEVESLDMTNLSFQFPEPLHCGKIIFKSDSVSKSYGNKKVINDLNLDIYNGDRIAFVGKNGCGKTTLTKIINGEIDFEGKIKMGPKVTVSYFAQNQNDLLDPNSKIIEYVESIQSDKTSTQLRGLLGAFLFSGDDIYKKIKVLSGGEKARLALCGLLLSQSNVLILDEPTNHLDVFAKDILKQALIQYTGTLIVVSHDRDFLTGLTDRVIEFTENKIREYPGDINSYLQEKTVEIEIPVKKKDKKVDKYKIKKKLDSKLRRLNKDSLEIEGKIVSIEKEIKLFNDILSNQEIITEESKIDYDDYNMLNEKLNKQMANWEKIQIEIDDIKKQKE